MKGTTIAGLILIVLGIQALSYGAFNYSTESGKTGAAEVAAESRHSARVVVPLCLGAGSVLIGGLLLLAGGRKPD